VYFQRLKYILIVFLFFYIQGCDYNKKSTWVMLNVNKTGKQGDAHIISKGSMHFMIDTGQQYYVRSILIPYLRKHRITHLKGVLITHPHFDHYGGMKDLIESGISIDEIYMNMPTKEQMKREWWGGIIVI
jgi:beta-lactamase superfamily II metal-dependent hydrolase